MKNRRKTLREQLAEPPWRFEPYGKLSRGMDRLSETTIWEDEIGNEFYVRKSTGRLEYIITSDGGVI